MAADRPAAVLPTRLVRSGVTATEMERSVLPLRTRLGVFFAACLCALLPGCRTGSFPQYPSNYREYAYVADAGGSTVAVLDLVHVRQETELSVGPHPVALAAAARRNEIYAVSAGAGGNGSLTIIDAESNRVSATLPLGRAPSAIALGPAGRRLYVTNAAANNVSVVDVPNRSVVGVVGAGESPDALAVSPDNKTLVVANSRSGSASVLELDGDALPRLRAAFNGCPGAGRVVILPDSSKAFIACAGGHQVMVLGLRTLPSKRRHTDAQPDRLLAMLDVGQQPLWLALKPDGGEIFAADAGSDSISEIETGTNEVGGASLIGAHPVSDLVSADNALLWVANQDADTVAVYSIDDGKLINTVHVGSGPASLAFSADGHLLLAADERSGDVSVIRTFSRDLHREAVNGTLFTLLPAGNHPVAIVDKAFRLTR